MRRASQHMVSAGAPCPPPPLEGCKATGITGCCPLLARFCQHLAPVTEMQKQGNKMVRCQPSSSTVGSEERHDRAFTPVEPPQMRVHRVRVDNGTADLCLVAGCLCRNCSA